MSSIIIKEIDKPTSPTPEYANFSVVVPGNYNTEVCIEPEKIFDENGVYECSSQSEFKEKIGLATGAKAEQAAEWAAPNKKPEVEEPASFEELYVYTTQGSSKITEEEFWTTYKGQVYKVIQSEGALTKGKLKFEFKISETTNEYYSFELLNSYPQSPELKMVIIKTGNEGKDKIENAYKFDGNQIAYELLGQGYTVLYKQVDELKPEEETGKITLANLKKAEYWEELLDKSAYDFRYICLAGFDDEEAQKQIINLATKRGDCTALVDISDKEFKDNSSQAAAATAIENYAMKFSIADSNTAFFAPTVTYNESSIKVPAEYEANTTFPASFHYLACANKASENYAEWYAVAGYNRGISDYLVKSTGYKFGDIAATVLAPRRVDENIFRCVNLIVSEKKNYYIWGNRTAKAIEATDANVDGLKATHFLNVRQLCSTLKKKLYVICRQFTFDPNSDLLWINFCNAIRPTLDKMKADQGISNYRLLKVVNNAKAKLTAIIRIVPIEAVEDFDITLTLEDNLDGAIDVNMIEG